MTKQQLADGKAAAQAQQDNGGPKAENKLLGHEKLFSAESARKARGTSASKRRRQDRATTCPERRKGLLHRLSSDVERKTFGDPKSCFLRGSTTSKRRQHDRATACTERCKGFTAQAQH